MSLTVYDIDYSKFSVQMLPPDKRYPRSVRWIIDLLSPVQWIRDLWFGSYRTGSTDALWTAGTYAKYARVVFNSSVYESLINGNTDSPTVTTSWMLVQQNFLGLSERILFNGQTLVLTYALNSYLKTTFRQPNALSDVYITPGAIVIGGFLIAQTFGSSVGLTGSSATIGGRSAFSTPINFIIHIPTAVYAGTTENAIREFVNKYISVSLNYTIVTY